MNEIHIDTRLIKFFLAIPIFLISISVHEFAHAYSAFKLGDSTAKLRGRLTLNPFKHLDLIGSILVPLASYFSGFALIGWAKPVPINPNAFENERLGNGIVSFVGPFSNFVLAVFIFILMFVIPDHSIIKSIGEPITIHQILWYGVYLNIFLFLFNILPIPPLDGIHILNSILHTELTKKLANIGFLGSFVLLIFIYSPLWKYFTFVVNSILGIFASIYNY